MKLGYRFFDKFYPYVVGGRTEYKLRIDDNTGDKISEDDSFGAGLDLGPQQGLGFNLEVMRLTSRGNGSHINLTKLGFYYAF